MKQLAGDFVRLEQFHVERTIRVLQFQGNCKICGWVGDPSDSPHSNTAYWATARHVEQEHGFPLAEIEALAVPIGEKP